MALHRFGAGRVDPLVRLMLRQSTGLFVVEPPGMPQPAPQRKPPASEFRIEGSPKLLKGPV